MSSIPSNISRVPTLMASQFFLSNLTRTNLSMLSLQTQMATGRAVNKPSDDAVRASAISVLEGRLEEGAQRLRNLSAADASLNLLDSAVGEASELVLEAKAIAASQIGATSDGATRRQQAIVIDSLIRQMYDLTNRQHNGQYLFGGSTPTRQPVVEFGGGFRYVARGSGMLADLGPANTIPVTLGGESALGQVSSRLRASLDLNPQLTPDTRVSDLRGARGMGVSLGMVEFTFDGGPAAAVDLSGAETVRGVVDRLTAAIRAYETANGVTVLGPGGVYLAGGAIAFDMPMPAGPELRFSDVGSGATARDLGLDDPLTATGALSGDLDPRMTQLTELSAIGGLSLPLGTVRLRFSGAGGASVRDVDLSGANTIGDVISRIQTEAPGVRVQINAAGTGLDVFNEVSGPSLSIEEVGGGDTAGQLGIRSFSGLTRMGEFNGGRGVRVLTGSTDPETGAPDPARDVDFRITLGNGQSFTVDLRPQDLVTVQTVIDRINDQAAEAVAAGEIPAGAFQAGLGEGPGGIRLFDLAGLGEIDVERQNNSPAAWDLGLLGGTWNPGSASFAAQDRAGIRVDSVFTALIDLREALLADDSSGITFAAEALDAHVDRVASTRALVGVNANRVQRAMERQEDQTVLDERIRSELRDLDFTEAAIRLSLLQVQLQAGMAVAAQSQSRSLLDFLR